MKLTRYYITIPINDKNERYILINTLNGKMNVLDKPEVDCIESWKNMKDVFPNNTFQKKLLEQLGNGDYLFHNEIEEAMEVNKTLVSCKQRYEKRNQSITDVVFVISYRCNFACPYCYEMGATNHTQKIITRSMIDQAFSLHHNQIERISFYGGEPLLLQNREIIKYIISKAPGAVFSATTNGFYLEEYLDIFRPLRIKYIMVTLDGPREIHNQTRILKNGKPTYRKIEKGIRLFLKNDIPIKIRMNISPNNFDSCLKLRQDYINSFSDHYNSRLLMFELQPLFQLPISEKKKIEKQIYFAEVNGDNISPINSQYNTMIKTTPYPLRLFVNNLEEKFYPKYTHCDAESFRRFYDPDGNIYSCILALGNPQASIGSYFPEVSIKRKSMLCRNIESIEQCSNCKLRFFCGGGCANEIIDSEGDTLKPNCFSIKQDLFVNLPQLFKKYVCGKDEHIE